MHFVVEEGYRYTELIALATHATCSGPIMIADWTKRASAYVYYMQRHAAISKFVLTKVHQIKYTAVGKHGKVQVHMTVLPRVLRIRLQKNYLFK